uniref:Chromosome 7 open reading frame 25 n=1 Tax=Cyprinus carpio TaxID=7962 RepID=A0A8C1Z9E1_CYPCA
MATYNTLQDRIRVAKELLERVEKICSRQGREVEGRAKLCCKLRAELKFLQKVEAGKVVIKESHLQSTNLTHLRAIVESAENLENVVSVLHVFAYEGPDGQKQTLVVDVVANGGHTWVKAIGRKAEALHNIWQGRGQYGDKSVIRQAEDFLEASRQQPVQYSNPHIIFAFYNGVSSPMADRLKEMGLSVRGDIVAVNTMIGGGEEEEDEDEEDSEDKHGCVEEDQEVENEALVEEEEEVDDNDDSDDTELMHTRVDRDTIVASLAFPTEVKVDVCNRVNLDITTLITYVSSLSHGNCHFTFKEVVLTEQAAQERQEKVLPRLEEFMKGKELFACHSAVEDFRVILDTLGGPGEKSRAKELLARLKVVPDQPSERTRRLVTSSKVNRRSLMIFGTGDTLRAITMTANSGFIRAAANQGVRYSVFIHQPRALTEGKEWRATPI